MVRAVFSTAESGYGISLTAVLPQADMRLATALVADSDFAVVAILDIRLH